MALQNTLRSTSVDQEPRDGGSSISSTIKRARKHKSGTRSPEFVPHSHIVVGLNVESSYLI